MRVAALAGGTGGAKLAAGIQEIAGEELTVIANTGDDVEALGVHVSPDPDLCTYWLCDEIDEERVYRLYDLLRGGGFRALIGVPLIREERVVGALVIRRREAGEPRAGAALVPHLLPAIAWGLGVAVLLHLGDRAFTPLLGEQWAAVQARAEGPISLGGLATGVFYGGFTEEVMMRWGVMYAAMPSSRGSARKSGSFT